MLRLEKTREKNSCQREIVSPITYLVSDNISHLRNSSFHYLRFGLNSIQISICLFIVKWVDYQTSQVISLLSIVSHSNEH